MPAPEKVLPANESGCGCPLEVRYREALERIAALRDDWAGLTDGVGVVMAKEIAREALALKGA